MASCHNANMYGLKNQVNRKRKIKVFYSERETDHIQKNFKTGNAQNKNREKVHNSHIWEHVVNSLDAPLHMLHTFE